MAIETVGDAIAAAKVLYQGRDAHLPVKLDWWCEQLGPAKPLAAVTADDIDEGIRVLMETPKSHYKVNAGVHAGTKRRAAGTVNKYIAALGSLYKLLKTHRKVPRSFVSPVARGMLLPLDNSRTLQVTLEDVHRLVAAARLSNNKKMPALVAVACTTGLRKGNLQDLTWGSVDLRARTIDVRTTKNGTPTRAVIPEWAARELNRVRPDNPEPSREVFGRGDFKRAWASTVERAGIHGSEGWTFHHCRHIAASILAQSGASLPTIMACLNQKSPSMALRYSHLNTAALDQAMGKAWN